MGEYTPTEAKVRNAWHIVRTDYEHEHDYLRNIAEFDRFIARIKAEAVRGAAEDIRASAQGSAALQRAHDLAEGIQPHGTSTPNEVEWHQMGNWAHSALTAFADQIEKEGSVENTIKAVDELADAIRLTVEYVGNDLLPAREGWSWYDALKKHRPELAEPFERNPIILRNAPAREDWES